MDYSLIGKYIAEFFVSLLVGYWLGELFNFIASKFK